jgi:hypothetical protein
MLTLNDVDPKRGETYLKRQNIFGWVYTFASDPKRTLTSTAETKTAAPEQAPSR